MFFKQTRAIVLPWKNCQERVHGRGTVTARGVSPGFGLIVGNLSSSTLPNYGFNSYTLWEHLLSLASSRKWQVLLQCVGREGLCGDSGRDPVCLLAQLHVPPWHITWAVLLAAFLPILKLHQQRGPVKTPACMKSKAKDRTALQKPRENSSLPLPNQGAQKEPQTGGFPPGCCLGNLAGSQRND